jgi:Na+/melibiose symporter-like transporter
MPIALHMKRYELHVRLDFVNKLLATMEATVIYEEDTTLFSRVLRLGTKLKHFFVRESRDSGVSTRISNPLTWEQLSDLVTVRNMLLCLPSFSAFTSLIFAVVVSVPFYGSLGVNSDLLMMFVALSRAFESVLDPFVAQWYESVVPNDSVEWTLRIRACLLGAAVSGAMMGLHMSPPTSLTTSAALTAWFAWTYLALFTSLTFVLLPVSSMTYRAFPYDGSKGQYKRTAVVVVCELLQNTGLALTFMLYGYSSAAKEADTESRGIYASCYSDSGMGRSCLALPDTGKYVTYQIFDAKKWASEDDYGCKYTSSGALIEDPQTLYTPGNCLASLATTYNSACLEQYCACVGQCTNLANLDARRGYMSGAGWLLGSTLVASVTALVLYTHGWKVLFTRVSPSAATASPSATQPLEPIVPKLVNLFRNKVVRSFLAPWLLDSLVYMMVLGTITYYIRAVIKPEYALTPEGCNAATPIFGTTSAMWRCQSTAVTSLLLALIALTALLSTLVWCKFSQLVGVVRAWQVGSLFSALCILALVFSAHHGQTSKAVGLGMLIGVGFGSRFLSELVLIEVIHYYEFISGYQYQHTFAMFKAQFLKMAVVLMQLLPVAVFYEVDFDPNPAQYKKAPADVGAESSGAQVITIAIPCVLCVLSFLAKMQFRLVDDEQFDLTAEGIKLLYQRSGPTTGTTGSDMASSAAAGSESPITAKVRKSGRSSKTDKEQAAQAIAEAPTVFATDPTSGIHYPAALLSHDELVTAQLFSHFPDTQDTIDYHSCAQSQSPYIGKAPLLIFRSCVRSIMTDIK